MRTAVLPLATTLALAACAVKGPAIDVTQRGVLIPSGHFSIGTGAAEAPSRPQGGAAFELALGRAAGRSTQWIHGGERVQLGEGAFDGPRQLENEAEAAIADAWLRVRGFGPGQKLATEALVGLSLISLDLATRSGAQRLADSWNTQGLSFGAGLLYRALPETTLHARYSFTLTGRVLDQTHIHRLELAGVQALGRNLAARAGYSWWAIDATPTFGSEITVRLSGPTIGLDVSF